MLIASTRIVTKLQQKHNVTIEEVEECISNLDPSHKLLTDTRGECNNPSYALVCVRNE